MGSAKSDHPKSGSPKSASPKSAGPKSAGSHSNTEKDPSDWTTGDEPMTGAHASYLKTLSEEASEEFDPSLSKADASRRIDELQNKTGRGKQT
jgi:hypothetical protein